MIAKKIQNLLPRSSHALRFLYIDDYFEEMTYLFFQVRFCMFLDQVLNSDNYNLRSFLNLILFRLFTLVEVTVNLVLLFKPIPT